MKKNWYALTLPELIERKTKLVDWAMEYPTHDKQKEAWATINEICGVIEIKEQATKDEFLQTVIDTLCL